MVVSRLFNLRRAEVGPVSLLFFYLFLEVGSYMIGQAVGDALFLDAFPRGLPRAMIGTALLIGVVVSIYIRVSTRVSLESLITGTLAFFSLSFVGFWWLAHSRQRWVYVLVYVCVYVAGAMGPMMGWTLANFALTTREARRVFGFIGAGAILGGTFFSFATSDLLRHEHAAPHNLLLGVGVLHTGSLLLVKWLFRSARKRLAVVSQGPTAGRATPTGFVQSLNLIRGSRYLLLVAGLATIGCLATCILGYQFKVIAKDSFGTDTKALAVFFSRFYGYMGLAALVFQLAFTGPLLRSFGLRVTLMVVPVALMCSSIGVLLAPTLLMGSILRGTHSLLRHSLDRSSMELLYLPVSPDIRSQVKSFIDTFVWRLADGIAGLVLIFFTGVMKLTTGEITLVNLVFLGGWLIAAYRVRREYLNVLREAIQGRTLDPDRTAAQVLDSTTTEVLAQSLARGSEQQLLYRMKLFEMGQTALHPALRGLLDHKSPAVRVAALRLLGDAGDQEVLPDAERMLGDEVLEVRAEALRYIAVNTGRDPLTMIQPGSRIPAYAVQGAIAVYFAQNTELDSSAAVDLLLDTMLSQPGPDAAKSRAEAARLLGVIPHTADLHDKVEALLRDQSPDVVEQALLSAGKIRDPRHLPLIIEKLGQPHHTTAARASLVLYGNGALEALRERLSDQSTPMSVRRQLPKVLAQISTLESAAVLGYALTQSDPGLRFDVLKALNKLRDRDPGLLPQDVDFEDMVNLELMGYFRSFQILASFDSVAPNTLGQRPHHSSAILFRRALLERMELELERIFRLLALVYPSRDIHNAFIGVTSRQAQLKANALEVLEHIIQPEMYRRLVKVLDPEIGTQERLEFARQFCRTEVGSPAEALRILLHTEDAWMRACALYAIGGLRMLELASDVLGLARTEEPLLSETLDWTVAQLTPYASA